MKWTSTPLYYLGAVL